MIELGKLYKVTSGNFSGKFGILKPCFLKGCYWLKTGKSTEILVTECQIEQKNDF